MLAMYTFFFVCFFVSEVQRIDERRKLVFEELGVLELRGVCTPLLFRRDALLLQDLPKALEAAVL